MDTSANPSPSVTPIRDTSAQDRPLASSPRRRWRVAAVVAAAVALGAALLWSPLGRLSGASGSVSASRLTLATVERGPLVRDVAGEGRVVAASSPTLYAAHGGTVELKVNAGDLVKRGQLLAVVASPELEARLAQERSNADALLAEAQRADVEARTRRAALQGSFDTARIDHATAENDLARHQKAFDAGAVSGMQVERTKDALEKARIALAQAKSNLALAEDSLRLDVQSKQAAHQRQRLQVTELQRQLEALQVRSPVDGQVGQLFVAPRAQVAADAKLLTVVDLSALEVQMQVPESLARDLAIGMPGEISGNGGQWRGRISAVSPEVVDSQVAARLRFDGATPPQLRQNQRLSVRVLIEQRDNVLSVRRGSFVEESGGRYAYVVRDGVAERRPVKLGATSTARVEVLDGLQPGDEVVVAGAEAFGHAPRVAISR